MMLAWSVPTERLRTPRPPGELERHWDEFTKRAGFVHQRKKTRRKLYLLGFLSLILAFVVWADIAFAPRYLGAFHYVPIALNGDSAELLPGRAMVSVAAGSEVRVRSPERDFEKRGVWLRGSARFRVKPKLRFGFIPSPTGLSINVGRARILIPMGEVEITRRGDVVDVHVLRPAPDSNAGVWDQTGGVAILNSLIYPERLVSIVVGQHGRIVRDSLINLSTEEHRP